MDCFEITVPPGTAFQGVTADGDPAPVYPGEYLVHLLPDRIARGRRRLLRFVGADATGRDVHVPLEALRPLPGMAAAIRGHIPGAV
jgi:hypothetical protein